MSEPPISTPSPAKAAAAPPDTPQARAAALIEVVRAVMSAVRPGGNAAIRMDSALDRDLGLDSLARVELLLRLERTFGVSLPENTLQHAETPRDLLAAVDAAHPLAEHHHGAHRELLPTSAEVVPGTPAAATDLIEVLHWHVKHHAERTHVICLADDREERITYAALLRAAQAAATGLQRAGLAPGETVAIMLPTSPAYFYVYLGILLAGGVPVPIYPPVRLSQIEEHVRRHVRILENARTAILVTVPEALAAARLLQANTPHLRRVLDGDTLATTTGSPEPVVTRAANIAFIQYTSGSTGDPKGVVLTHANLLANIRAMARATRAGPQDVFVSWLPLYHDMGLIGAWLGSLYLGCPLVIMSPLAFLARPQRWLWAIHEYRGTLSAGPNFAYELCLQRLTDSDLEGLDLGSWRYAFNGAEAVNPDTMLRFTERFRHYGLNPGAVAPVYGLAESSVGLLFPPPARGLLIDRIERAAFERHGNAVPAAADDPNPLRFVACGQPLAGHEVRIVDHTGREVGERMEGRLEFTGPSSTAGYYHNPEQTRRLIRDGWLDSGDRAYVADGEVYITGRVKDIIIRAGRNIYPHEIEEAVAKVPGVRKGCIAAFGSPDPHSGTERLIVLAETRESGEAARRALRSTISAAVVDVLGEPPDEVVLAPPHTVLKTSSGKVRRSSSRELYEEGQLGAGPRAPWLQLLRLTARAARTQLWRRLQTGGEWFYGVWVWLVFGLLAPPVWLLVALTPHPEWAWRISGVGARLLLKLTGTPLIVRGLENLPGTGHNVLVANHASYLDGLILVAALPAHYSFVAKRELAGHPVSGIYLRRIGSEFVERWDTRQSSDDAKRLADAVTRGRSLAFFPEGTFKRMPGLLPFRLGAFAAAATANVPVVPVTIRGSRSMLRDTQWLPRRTTLVVSVAPPVMPPGPGTDPFAAAVTMRDAARAVMLADCGEPDLQLQGNEEL